MAKEILTKERCARDLLSDLKVARITILTYWIVWIISSSLLAFLLSLLFPTDSIFSIVFTSFIALFILCCLSLTIYGTISYFLYKSKIKKRKFIIVQDVLMEKRMGEFHFRNSNRQGLFSFRLSYMKQGGDRRYAKKSQISDLDIYYFESAKRYIPVTKEDVFIKYAEPHSKFYTVIFNKKSNDIFYVYSEEFFTYNE